MLNRIVAEGKTTNEAIANGLKQLNVSKEQVEIKVLENTEKRSFFSILAPRIVKVELTVKEGVAREKDKHQPTTKQETENAKREINQEDIEKAKGNLEQFLKEFSNNFSDIRYEIKLDKEFVKVDIQGNDSTKLIGYRGDVLNSLQTIMNSIANKKCVNRVRVILNIGDYKEKREKALIELAEKLSKTVLKTGKSVTLEPMVAYERKIIHNYLQEKHEVKTYSVGDEPYRKIVIAKNK